MSTDSKWQSNSIAFRVEKRLVPGYQPTPEEAAEWAEQSRLRMIERNKQALIREAAWGQLRLFKDPGIRAVLDLHAMTDTNHDPECAHCYWDTEMSYRDYWPCETVRAIAAAYGIEMPA